MGWIKRTLRSTVGRKLVVGITGLGLVLFLVGHLAGNLQLFYGDQGAAFNKYAAFLHGLGIFPLIEIGLVAFFVIHIGLTLKLAAENRAARGSRYEVKKTKRDSLVALLASKTMVYTGVITLAFIVVHVADFRLQHEAVQHTRGGDLYGYVMEVLGSGWRPWLYMVGSALVGFHVFHGFSSAFRSLGTTHRRVLPWLDKLAPALALVLGLGFAAIPFWIFFIR